VAVSNTPTVTSRALLRPERDERLTLYVVVATLALGFALFDGGLRLMLIAVPFATAVALGARNRAASAVVVRITLDSGRCIEGDDIDGRIEIAAPPDLAIELAVARVTDDIAPPEGHTWAWSVPIGVERPVGLPISLHAVRWGRVSAGSLEVRLVDHGSLFHRRTTVLDVPEIDVLPAGQRLDRLLDLDSAQTAAGAHTTRRLATGGYDFAEVREYRPGDRLRDLNWSATLRLDSLQVNHRFPERAGDVVIIIDSFPDALRRHSEIGRDVITWAGRLAWSIATAHLASNDRVGIAVEGARTRWLPPQAGRRAKLAVFQMLLQSTISSGDRRDHGTPTDRIQVPPSALVVAISPLARPRTMEHLTSLRSQGHAVRVMALDTGQLLDARASSLPPAVARLRTLMFEERVASLRRRGVQVIASGPDDDVGRSVRAMSRGRRRIGLAR
jgi:uncharacterized protein (DUF58 family)